MFYVNWETEDEKKLEFHEIIKHDQIWYWILANNPYHKLSSDNMRGENYNSKSHGLTTSRQI